MTENIEWEIVPDECKVYYDAGVLTGLEQAAKLCDERAVVERAKAAQNMDAESCGRALSREAAAKSLSKTIRALSVKP